MGGWTSADRIADIQLDEKYVVRHNPTVAHERASAIYDLLQENRFRPVVWQGEGPFTLRISIVEGKRLCFAVRDREKHELGEVILALSSFRALVRDYFQICESYYDAIRRLSPSRIEAIDMARRGLHDEAAALLRERLAGKLDVDIATARRLFTLICVLHIQG